MADIKKSEKPAIKMVKIQLQKTKEKKSDAIVSVNGQTFQIKRGVEVEVPYYVEKVLRNSEKMDVLALERSEAAVNNIPE